MKRNLRFFIPILCCVVFSSCLGMLKGIIKEDGKQIPMGFGKEDVTILAIKHGRRNYDKRLEKNFTSSYFGKYVFVTAAEEKTDYPDVDKYRYTFEETISYNTSIDAQGRSHTLAAGSFYLQDRKTGVKYNIKLESGLWSKLMRIYLDKLEAVRKKNSGN